MNNPQNILFAGLIITNVVACFGAAIPLAAMLHKKIGQQHTLKRYFTLLIGIYFLEGIVFTIGMCTQVFTFGLAVIWGIILGLWWKGKAEPKMTTNTAFWFSLYTCAPTVSFSICLVIMWVYAGKDLLSVIGAKGFGIPQFVPWPFNTILGFCAGLAIGTLLIKITITTGLVKLLARRQTKSV